MIRTLTSVIVLSAIVAIGAGPVAAQASTPTTLTYHFFDCAGPARVPSSFDGVKQPGSAAALRIVGTNEVYVAMEAVVLATGEVLFTTPGIQNSARSLTTCLVVHPVAQNLQRVKGVITPSH